MKKGFTLVELMVVMFIVASLLAIVYIDVLSSQRKATVTSDSTQLIADIKSQQLKAMGGQNGGVAMASPSGIAFSGNTYTLYTGAKYQSSDPNNFSINLDTNLQLISSFSGNVLTFASGSGEVADFSSGSDTITIVNSFSQDKKVIKLNRYGVITALN